MRRLLPALALLTATPAFAQASADPVPAFVVRSVDAGIVGTWELAEVENAGAMAELGAEIEQLVLRIESDGDATVEMEVVQDRETIEKEDAFHCTTEDGQILRSDRTPIDYEVLSEEEIRLTDPQGIVLRMRRAGSDTASL